MPYNLLRTENPVGQDRTKKWFPCGGFPNFLWTTAITGVSFGTLGGVGSNGVVVILVIVIIAILVLQEVVLLLQ